MILLRGKSDIFPFIGLLSFPYKYNVMPYIVLVEKNYVSYRTNKASIYRHNNPSLLKKILGDFSLVVRMAYY
jgi:hypothetical protein